MVTILLTVLQNVVNLVKGLAPFFAAFMAGKEMEHKKEIEKVNNELTNKQQAADSVAASSDDAVFSELSNGKDNRKD